LASVAAGGVLAVSLVAACGGSSGGGGTSNEGTPVKGGKLTMLGVGDLDHVDSAAWYYTTDYELANLTLRQLVTYDRKGAGKGYPGTKIFGQTPVPDAAKEIPTTGNGGITNGGKTYTFHIKPGIKWNTSPPRQVTAADFIRGIARTCNPIAPFGALSYFQSTIVGFDKFCSGELALDLSKANGATVFKSYIDTKTPTVTGMKASDATTLVFTLNKPANDWLNILALAVASPVPVEYLKYKPDSPQLKDNLLSCGPYKIDKYIQTKTIDLSRNPAWDGTTDDNRKAYVDSIHIVENLTQEAVQQQIQAGTADMEWDTFPVATTVPALLAAKDPNLSINDTSSSNPYLVFNTVSPNNNGAMTKKEVRQAISYAVNKTNVLQVLGGKLLNNQLNQVLPTVIKGGETQFEPYPYDAAKAKSMLTAAGYPNGITIKLLYRTVSKGSTKAATTLQADLPKAGIKVQLVGTNNQDFYGKYLQVKPNITKKGLWDAALAGWGADWDGNAARTFFLPLFDGRSLAPESSNFGDYNNPAVNALIDQALSASSVDAASALWHQADQKVMEDAAFVPLTNPRQANYHNSKRVHNFIYTDAFQNGDPTNIWLK
jgi:peptide/nickel transport system substrate-binding protein